MNLDVRAGVCRRYIVHKLEGNDALEMTSTTSTPHTLSTSSGLTLKYVDDLKALSKQLWPYR